MGCATSSSANTHRPTGPSPDAFEVSGAGIGQVNGVYKKVGIYDGVPCYENGQLWLLRYKLPSGDRWWYIADKALLDRDDGDLYRVKAGTDTPPHFGWQRAKDGMDPPPTLDIFRPDAIGIATPAAMVTCIATPVAMATPAADPVALPVTPAGGAMQVIVYATPQDMPIVDGILLQPAQAVMDWGNVPVTMAVSVEEVSGSAWVPTPETLCIGDCL